MKISEIINEDLQRPTMNDVQQWWIRNVTQIPEFKKISKDITHQDIYNAINTNWNEYKHLEDANTVISLAFQRVITDYAEKLNLNKPDTQQPVQTPSPKSSEPEYRKDIAGRTLRDPRYYRDREKPTVRDRAAAAKTRAGRAYRVGRDLPSKIASSGPAQFMKNLRDISKKLK